MNTPSSWLSLTLPPLSTDLLIASKQLSSVPKIDGRLDWLYIWYVLQLLLSLLISKLLLHSAHSLPLMVLLLLVGAAPTSCCYCAAPVTGMFSAAATRSSCSSSHSQLSQGRCQHNCSPHGQCLVGSRSAHQSRSPCRCSTRGTRLHRGIQRQN